MKRSLSDSPSTSSPSCSQPSSLSTAPKRLKKGPCKPPGTGNTSKPPTWRKLPPTYKVQNVDRRRVRVHGPGFPDGEAVCSGKMMVWMSRDHRLHDNWSILFAQDIASDGICVVFNVVTRSFLVVPLCRFATVSKPQPIHELQFWFHNVRYFNRSFLNAPIRHFDFMLRGLQDVEKDCKEYHIPFLVVCGDPVENIPRVAKNLDVSAVITDFSPMRLGVEWRDKVAAKLSVPLFEVDSHNVVPCWCAYFFSCAN